ncbi:unnamed protein product [Phaeothamnion confervicola]
MLERWCEVRRQRTREREIVSGPALPPPRPRSLSQFFSRCVLRLPPGWGRVRGELTAAAVCVCFGRPAGLAGLHVPMRRRTHEQTDGLGNTVPAPSIQNLDK